jgi:hypothetical protein
MLTNMLRHQLAHQSSITEALLLAITASAMVCGYI